MASATKCITTGCFTFVVIVLTLFDYGANTQSARSSNSTRFKPAASFAKSHGSRKYLRAVFSRYGNGTYISFISFKILLNKLAVGQVFLDTPMNKVGMCVNNTQQSLKLKVDHVPHHHEGVRTGKIKNRAKNKNPDENKPGTTPLITKGYSVRRSSPKRQSTSGKDVRSLRVLPLKIDRTEGNDHNQHMDNHHQKCLTPDELFQFHELNPGQDLSKTDFLRICPALISQVESGVCIHQHLCSFNKLHVHDDAKLSQSKQYKVWAFGFLAVTVISLTSLCIITVIPCLEKRFFNAVMGYLVALAVGTLSGDALLHLIPHSLATHKPDHKQQHSDHNQGVWTSFIVLVGIYLFFLVERLMSIKSICKREGKGKYSNNVKLIVGEGLPPIPEVKFETSNAVNNLPEAVFLPVVDKDCEKSIHNCDETCDGYIEDSAVESTASPSSPSGNRGISPTTNTEETTDVPCCPDHDLRESLISSRLNENRPSNDCNKNKCEIAHNDMEHPFKHEHDYGHKDDHEHEHSHALGHGHSHGDITKKTSIASVAWMVIVGDGFHNFSDGLAIGAAFAASMTSGIGTSIAVFCHELPHELGDFAVLIKSGMSVKQAITYNLVSAILSYIGLVIGIIVGNYSTGRQFALAITAGLFLYVSLANMLPGLTAKDSVGKENSMTSFITQNLGILTGISMMLLISLYEDKF